MESALCELFDIKQEVLSNVKIEVLPVCSSQVNLLFCIHNGVLLIKYSNQLGIRSAMIRKREFRMKHCCAPKQDQILRLIIKGIIILISAIIIFQFIYENSSLYFRTNNILHRRTLFSLHLNQNDIYLKKGEEFHLYVVALNKRVSFTSTDFRVAGVNFNGRVYAYQTGDCFILAKVDDRILKCRVHVVDINKRHLTITSGRTKKLHIQGSSAFVRWKSSNPDIASVSMFGRVKGKSKGKVIIYGRIKGKTFTCVVRVNE